MVVQECSHSLALIVSSGRFCYSSHDMSGICHISFQESDRFLCGRSVFGRYSQHRTLSEQSGRLCHICHNVAVAQLEA